MSTYEDLKKQLHRRAKLADQYMRRLEKLSNEKGYEHVLQFAYARARRDIRAWSGEDAKRFDTKAPRTVQGIRAKLSDIERFLSSPTATKTGIKNIYEKRAKTLSERYGVSADWQDMAKYYSRGTNEKFDNLYGSKTSLLAVGKIQKNARAVQKALKKGDLDVFVASNFSKEDEPVQNAIKEMMQLYEKDLKKAGIL